MPQPRVPFLPSGEKVRAKRPTHPPSRCFAAAVSHRQALGGFMERKEK